jgi:hypothetical protein
MSAQREESRSILPRELTAGLSDDVRDAPAPATPVLAEPYALRLVDPDADAEMISRWMNMPHLVEAWESAWPVSRWREYLRAQLDGNYSRPFVGSMHGEDGGYVEVYRAAKDSIATRYHADPYDIGLHAAIAELTARPVPAAAYRRKRLRRRTTLPPNHVRSRPPQHLGATVV